MRIKRYFILSVLFISIQAKSQAPLNDDCSSATLLCGGNTLFMESDIGATSIGSDPSLDCGPSSPKATVWYTVTAIGNGTATVTLSNVNVSPGLTVEAFTGSCGAYTPLAPPQCATGTGTLSITFTTVNGTTYYVMVSERGSAEQTYDIEATSASNSIIAAPVPVLKANPSKGCIPLTELFHNASILFGGSNFVYQLSFDGGPLMNYSGADTTVIYPATGTYSVALSVSNQECGAGPTSTPSFTAQNLFPTIGYAPSTSCVGTPISFTGSASVLPNPPVTNPNVTAWSWNFGDPNSGTNDSSALQNPTHTFVGPGSNFNVQLIVQGTCGPDTAKTTVSLLSQPVLHPSADQAICPGATATIYVSVTNGTAPINYTWSGNPTITCLTCDTTTVTGLAVGGPYTYTIHISDAHGCVADSVTHITVHPKPIVEAGNDTTVCKYTMLQLNAVVTTGTPPFTYAWSPKAGLSDSTKQNPIADITAPAYYCVTVTDSIGCTSDTDCILINIYPKPTISSAPTKFCSSDPGPNVATITVSGSPGPAYSWKATAALNYALITGTNADSSRITVTLPTGVVKNYDFTAIVTNPVTGCTDTVTVKDSVISGVNLSVSGPSNVCSGDNAILTASGATNYAWTANPPYPFSDSTDSVQVVSPIFSPTVFYVTGTTGSCSKTDSIVVITDPVPVVSAGNPDTVCKNSQLILNANVTAGIGPFTYSWSPSAGLDHPNIKNPTATISGPIIYCVTAFDTIGCPSAQSCISISIYPAPTVSSSHGPYCATDPGPDTTTFTVSGAGAGSTYRWRLSPNYNLITARNVADSSSVVATMPSDSSNTYNFTVIVNDGVTGCADTLFVSFTVTSGLNMTVTGTDTICSGQIDSLLASGATTYAWTAIPSYSFADSTQVLQPVTPVVTTKFIVKGTTGTCTQVDTFLVTVNPTPVVNAGSNITVCKNSQLVLHANVTSGTAPFTYLWSPSTGLDSSTVQNPTATITAPITYCVTVKDKIGCTSAPDCINIDIYPAPTIASSHAPYCSSDPGPDTTSLTVSPRHAASTYRWKLSLNDSLITGTNAVDSSSVQVTLPTNSPGNYNFTVIVNDGVTGCIDTVSIIVSESSGINLSVNGPFTICIGQTDTLIASGAGMYAWTAIPAYSFADSTDSIQVVSPIVTTKFIVNGSVGSCTAVDTILVTVNPLPIAMADSINPVCGCATVSLNGTGSSSGPQIKYKWTSAQESMIANPTQEFTTAVVCTSDTFTLTVTDTVTGCLSSVSMPVNSLSKPAAVCHVAPSLICNAVSTVVTLDGTGSDASVGTTYLWTSVPAVSITNADTIFTTATITGFTVFTLTVTNAAGCDSVFTEAVDIYPLPTFTASPGMLCTFNPPLVDTLTVNGASPGSTYNWTTIPPCVTPPSTTDSSQAFNFSICGVGSYAFTVVVTDVVTGCIDTLNTSVNVVNGVTLVAGSNQPICEGDSLILTASGANTYLWNTGATTDTLVVKGLTAAMSPDTFIVAGAIGSCFAVDTIIVTIHPTPVTSAINGPVNVCTNDSTTNFTVTNNPGDIYTWTVTGGAIIYGQTTDSIIVAWGPPGPGTVTVHEQNAFGCTGADQTLNVTINPKPITSAISPPGPVCDSAFQSYSVTPVAGSSYQWFVNGGSFPFLSTSNPVFVQWGSGPTGTIQVVETNAAGCTGDTVSLTITVFPPPATPVITGPDTLCANTIASYSVPQLAGANYLWYTLNGASIISNIDSSTVLINWGGNAGTDIIYVSETDSNGCNSSTGSVGVLLYPVPATSAITPPGPVCDSAFQSYLVANNVGSTYQWFVTGGSFPFSSNSNNVFVQWGSGPATDTLLVAETNSFGCSDTVALSITVLATLATPVITGPVILCADSIATYSVPQHAGSNYLWYTLNGASIISNIDSSSVLIDWGGNAGTDIIYVSETDSNGCNSLNGSLGVLLNPVPVTSAITGNVTVCEGDSDIYYVTYNAGNSYAWTVTDGSILKLGPDTIQVTWDSAATGILTVVETNTFGCGGPVQTLNVTVNPIPVTSAITGATGVCENTGDSVYIVAGDPNNTFTWTVTGGTIDYQLTDTIGVFWGSAGTGIITVMETTPLGCNGLLQQLNVAIHPLPVSTAISGPASTCTGDTLMYVATGDTGSTFQWTVSGGTFTAADTGATISVLWPLAGSGFLQVTETSKFGCPGAPASEAIVINPLPTTSAISGNIIACITDTGNIYYVDLTAGSTYLWTAPGDTIVSQNIDTITVNWLKAGLDSIFVVETNSFGCIGPADTQVVNVSAKPFAGASASRTTLCQNDTVQLTGVDSNAASVTWSTSGSGTFNDSTIISPIYTAGATDSGKVVLTFVVHNPPCADALATDTLIVNPTPKITITPPSPTLCQGDTDTLAASVVGSYLWTPGNDTTSSIMIHPDTTTTYTVKVTNGSGCSALDSALVTVILPGTASAGPDQSLCIGDSVSLSGTIANAGGGVWTSSGNGTFVPNTFNLNATYVPGSHDTTLVQLVLTTTGACRNGTDTLVVDFEGFSSVNAGLDQTITFRDSAHLKGKAVNAGGIWTSNGTGTFVPGDTVLNAVYAPSSLDLQQDSIILTLTSTHGCITVSDFMVIHFSDFVIPNVMTPYPNSPGYNDYFEMKGLPPNSKLKVWNRWGLLVYESDNYRNDWDGENVETGVYYYVVITPKNEFKGWVEVIR